MPYGQGFSRRELRRQAREVASRPAEEYVITAPGVRMTVGTKRDAEIVAAKFDGAKIRKARA